MEFTVVLNPICIVIQIVMVAPTVIPTLLLFNVLAYTGLDTPYLHHLRLYQASRRPGMPPGA